MISAIFGLVGVVVGGLLTAGVEAYRARRADERQVRIAARILRDELAWWHTSIAISLGQGEWLVDSNDAVRAAWLQHREALCVLDRDDWARVSTAVAVTVVASSEMRDGPFDNVRPSLEEAEEHIGDGVEALERFID
jgi:hypothetical protein